MSLNEYLDHKKIKDPLKIPSKKSARGSRSVSRSRSKLSGVNNKGNNSTTLSRLRKSIPGNQIAEPRFSSSKDIKPEDGKMTPEGPELPGEFIRQMSKKHKLMKEIN